MAPEPASDPHAPIRRIVRDIVIHVAYLALSVAVFFVVRGLGFDVKIHIYFVVVLLVPAAVWLVVLARRKRVGRESGDS